MRSKYIVRLIIISIIVLVAIYLNPFNTVSINTDITVVEKGYSKAHKESWVVGFNPNADAKYREKIKILVKDPVVWYQIEDGKTYFVTYLKKGNNLSVLKNIANIEVTVPSNGE